MIKKIGLSITSLLLLSMTQIPIKNATTTTVTIMGQCGHCQKMIEDAGTFKNVAVVTWDMNQQLATLVYDSKRTTKDAILKRIALAGFDNEMYYAPDDMYTALPSCCQYMREKKPLASEQKIMDYNHDKLPEYNFQMGDMQETPLAAVFDTYFMLKDALVGTDPVAAASAAGKLGTAIKEIAMEQLPMEAHMAWMKVYKNLLADAEKMAQSQDIAKQRASFIPLSDNMYTLMKASKLSSPTYYQFCPMADGGKGAHWLSKDSDIANPFYGSQMLGCGKTVETLD